MNHIGREQTVTIAGKPYALKRLTRAVLRSWHDWAKNQLPPVVESICRVFECLPKPVQSYLADEALNTAEDAQDFNSTAVASLWYTRDGTAVLLSLLLAGDERDRIDLACTALEEQGEEVVGKWIGEASGRVIMSTFDLETKLYQRCGFLPEPIPSKIKREWGEIDKDIFQNCGLTPKQVDEMTLPEIATVLSSKEELNDGIVHLRVMLWKKVTPEHKLQLAVWTSDQ